MKRSINSLRRAALFIGFLACRCATATNGRYERINVVSDPPGAAARIECEGGWRSQGLTPVNLVVPRKADPCVVRLTADGHAALDVPLERVEVRDYLTDYLLDAAEPEEWLGPDAFSCVIGVAVFSLAYASAFVADRIDDHTGAIYEHKPNPVRVQLLDASGEPFLSNLREGPEEVIRGAQWYEPQRNEVTDEMLSPSDPFPSHRNFLCNDPDDDRDDCRRIADARPVTTPRADELPKPDYSREALLRLFAEWTFRREQPRTIELFGVTELRALGTRWRFIYMPFLAPYPGSIRRANAELPNPFADTGTEIAHRKGTWNRDCDMSDRGGVSRVASHRTDGARAGQVTVKTE